MLTITIPQKLTNNKELIVIPLKEYEEYLRMKETSSENATEENILKWSREAKILKKTGKLPVLGSLRDLR